MEQLCQPTVRAQCACMEYSIEHTQVKKMDENNGKEMPAKLSIPLMFYLSGDADLIRQACSKASYLEDLW